MAQTSPAGHWEGVASMGPQQTRLSLDLAKNAKSEWEASMGVPAENMTGRHRIGHVDAVDLPVYEERRPTQIGHSLRVAPRTDKRDTAANLVWNLHKADPLLGDKVAPFAAEVRINI